MYIKRNENHEITAISRMDTDGFSEYLDDDASELQKFLRDIQPQRQKNLAESDLEMARVVEDLVGLLIDRSVIRFTDLPAAAQSKLLSRRELRTQHLGMNLLDDEDDLKI
jgi:hypothetical protein